MADSKLGVCRRSSVSATHGSWGGRIAEHIPSGTYSFSVKISVWNAKIARSRCKTFFSDKSPRKENVNVTDVTKAL